jgi:hypothetical protein
MQYSAGGNGLSEDKKPWGRGHRENQLAGGSGGETPRGYRRVTSLVEFSEWEKLWRA